jgi:hypothetical protein
MNPYLQENQCRLYKDKSTKTTLFIRTVAVLFTAIGGETKLGTIGNLRKSRRKTPLEVQIGNFVKKWLCRSCNFFIVWIINF